MYKGYVFPIGDLPNDLSWTGFQNYNPDNNSGYLTIFREINNAESGKSIELKFLKNKSILVEDLITGSKSNIKVDADGKVLFKIDKPASFLYLKYTRIN